MNQNPQQELQSYDFPVGDLNATRGLLLIKENNPLEGQRLYNKAAKLASDASNEELRRKIQQKKFLELARYELKGKQLKPARKYLNEVMKFKTTDSIFQRQARDLLNANSPVLSV